MSGDGWGTSFAQLLEQEKDYINRSVLKIIPKIYDVEKEHNNKVPTHDPYTNPNAEIYFSCNCGAILDPGTKSFAALTTFAGNHGWKIRFSDSGYIPYCVDCGRDVE